MIPGALRDLRQHLEKGLTENNLAPEGPLELQTFATSRRLVAFCPRIAAKQPTVKEAVQGPPKKIAYDAQGNPTPAAIQFAAKNGTTPDKLKVVTTPKGEYLSVRVTRRGRPAIEILSELIPQAVKGIYFPRTMHWDSAAEGKTGTQFIRPVRNLLALCGGRVIPCSIGNVKSGKTTFGHRNLSKSGGKPLLAVKTFADYRQTLASNGVLLDPSERRARILDEAARLLQFENGLKLKPSPELLETHTYLTEHPTPLLGGFDPAYLSLPEEVLITVMRGHQKYFAVEDAAGKLAPRFIAVLESDGDSTGVIRHGHERVLRARFNDAQFFWKADGETALQNRLESLRNVTFQAKLGSYFEKSSRMQALADALVSGLRHSQFVVDPQMQTDIMQAARMAKCDLTTDLVKEFTELQGIIGGLSARRENLSESIATAIYDHYLPQSMEDGLPRSLGGNILSLADRMDTLVGCFGVGLAPTGSKDPFGLRRAAQGVIRILAEKQLPLTIDGLVGAGCEVYRYAQRMGEAEAWTDAAARQPLIDFFEDRLRYYLREVRGFAYDEVAAVLQASGSDSAATNDDVADILKRVEAVALIRTTEDFEPLAASFKRMKNIIEQARKSQGFTSGRPQPELFSMAEETALHAKYEEVFEQVAREKSSGNYTGALQMIASLRPAVDLFFDKVLVMDPDLDIRTNRLCLLDMLLNGFSTIADFSEIVPRESKPA
ncbi:MAG: glycine--tRNA ligase subunit beta [Acidobacteria bacterium]|nr:glycine--tRNA ligase subunit beta [Acidobacteriota bacterium]